MSKMRVIIFAAAVAEKWLTVHPVVFLLSWKDLLLDG